MTDFLSATEATAASASKNSDASSFDGQGAPPASTTAGVAVGRSRYASVEYYGAANPGRLFSVRVWVLMPDTNTWVIKEEFSDTRFEPQTKRVYLGVATRVYLQYFNNGPTSVAALSTDFKMAVHVEQP